MLTLRLTRRTSSTETYFYSFFTIWLTTYHNLIPLNCITFSVFILITQYIMCDEYIIML